MAQLVGTTCIHCDGRISNELDAAFCTTCGQPGHAACGKPAGVAGRCSACGAPHDHASATPTPQSSRSAAIQALMVHIAERLRRGEQTEVVRTDQISQGISSEIIDQLLAMFAPSKWEQGARGWTLRIVGIAVILSGGFLWLGNQNGFFLTFPFAGTLVMLLGVGIYVFGGGKT